MLLTQIVVHFLASREKNVFKMQIPRREKEEKFGAKFFEWKNRSVSYVPWLFGIIRMGDKVTTWRETSWQKHYSVDGHL